MAPANVRHDKNVVRCEKAEKIKRFLAPSRALGFLPTQRAWPRKFPIRAACCWPFGPQRFRGPREFLVVLSRSGALAEVDFIEGVFALANLPLQIGIRCILSR